MTTIDVAPVESRDDVRDFVRLPWTIYRGDSDWVPQLVSEVKDTISPTVRPSTDARGALSKVEGRESESPKVVHQAFVARQNGEPIGRILAAFDPLLNGQKNSSAGHLSLFECANDQKVADALFDAAFSWLRENGITLVRGPVCPSGPALDEMKGLLVEGFEHRPVVLTSYNPPYYQQLFECAGFEKDADVFAYRLEATRLFEKNPSKIVEYAARRYGFRIDGVNKNDIESEVRAIKHVLDLAVPAEWEDMVPPSVEEVRAMANRLVPILDPDLTGVVRVGDEPVGFGLAIPDYNQVLAHLDGRIGVLGALKYLWYRRRINCARIFIMFVVPAYRQRGVAHAIYYRIFERGTAKGYMHGEASTIGETNRQMRADIEKMGGERYKTYRVYGKTI